MKSIFIIQTIIFILSFTSLHFSQNLNDSLFAFYPFSGNTSDVSGNQRDGIVCGPNLTEDRFGISNSAYIFNGVNDYIQTPYCMKVEEGHNYTVTCWFNPTKSDGMLLTSCKDPWTYVGVGIDCDCKLWITSRYDNYVIVENSTVLTLNLWYFASFVFTGTRVVIYLNGLYDGEGVLMEADHGCISLIGSTNSVNNIYGIVWEPFGGVIDDMRIYDRALNENEIMMLRDSIYSKVNDNLILENKVYFLSQNYPNPFNLQTTINYSIPKSCQVILKIFDVMGKEITTLVNEEKTAGNYTVKVNPENLCSGIYYYKILAGNFNETKKLIFLK